MYSVSTALYHQVAMRLADAIGGSNYYSGSIVFAFGAAECRLTASVIVYRKPVTCPEGDAEPICDLVPIWWEFQTFVEGDEVLNDFDFKMLKRYL